MPKEKTISKTNQDIECYLCCQSGHYRKDFPLLVEAGKYLIKTKRVKLDKKGTVQAALTKSEKRKSNGNDDTVFITYEVSLASGRSLLERYDILYDNQATINIFITEVC